MKKKWRMLLTAVLVLVLAVSAGYLALKELDYRRGAQDYSQAEKAAGIPDLTRPSAAETAQPDPDTEASAGPEAKDPWLAALTGTDLEALRAENADVTGWICIPETDLSYPLLQGRDNQYYLNHTWRGQRSAVGAVFLDYRASGSLTDPYTLIYGHRMNNTSMFGTLKFYDSEEYWKAHPSVYLVHEGGVDRYDIFAAFEASVHSDVYRLTLPEERREEFLAWCREQSVIDTGAVPASGSRIITLSTCTSSGGAATRWVVLASLGDSVEVP